MLRKLISVFGILGLLLVVGPALAQPLEFKTYGLNTAGNPPVTLVLPTVADASPAIVELGSAVDPQSGKAVQGYAFVHYRNGHAKPPGTPGGKNGGGTNCFAYLAKGAKWKTVEPWVMNPSNTRGLDPTTLFGLEGVALAKWEDAADGVVGNGAGVEIFSAGSSTSTALSADTASPDGKNEVFFTDVSTTGAIAVTIVWGIFSGPTSIRELVEWDQVYDDVDFDWSAGAAGVAGKMDFDNIATHEDGHSAGMGHPDDSCTEETMYRFSTFAETKKRDLNAGDIAGVDGLY